jgi:hypothetical protein
MLCSRRCVAFLAASGAKMVLLTLQLTPAAVYYFAAQLQRFDKTTPTKV